MIYGIMDLAVMSGVTLEEYNRSRWNFYRYRPTEYNGYSNQGCLTEDGGVTAAQAALDAEISGYSDWYLPSKDELLEIYNTIGNGGPEGILEVLVIVIFIGLPRITTIILHLRQFY